MNQPRITFSNSLWPQAPVDEEAGPIRTRTYRAVRECLIRHACPIISVRLLVFDDILSLRGGDRGVKNQFTTAERMPEGSELVPIRPQGRRLRADNAVRRCGGMVADFVEQRGFGEVQSGILN